VYLSHGTRIVGSVFSSVPRLIVKDESLIVLGISSSESALRQFVLSTDKFISEVRATNPTGNGVAAAFMSRWEGELDQEKLS
jgi:hypothetical protein